MSHAISFLSLALSAVLILVADLMKVVVVDPTKPEAIEVAGKLTAKSAAKMKTLLARAR